MNNVNFNNIFLYEFAYIFFTVVMGFYHRSQVQVLSLTQFNNKKKENISHNCLR